MNNIFLPKNPILMSNKLLLYNKSYFLIMQLLQPYLIIKCVRGLVIIYKKTINNKFYYILNRNK